MKLLIDVRKMSRNPSGIGMYIYNFAREISNNKELDIIMITDIVESEEIKYFENANIKIYKYGVLVEKTIEVIKYFKYIQKIINIEKPEFFWEPNNVMPIKLKNNSGKIITTVHDIFPITNPEHHSMLFRAYYKHTLKNTIKNTDILLYVSNETKIEVESRYADAKEKMNHISYNIVNKLPDMQILDKGYFLYIGNVESRKGVDILIKAYEKYSKEKKEVNLLIAGGIRDNRLKEMMDNIEGIKYLGYISNYEKAKLMAECSCFIFPSKAEGFGIPPVEALSYNKPLILSNLSIFKEIIGENVNYFDINTDSQQQINNLIEQLDKFNENTIKIDNNKIIEKYEGKFRAKQFINFIKMIN